MYPQFSLKRNLLVLVTSKAKFGIFFKFLPSEQLLKKPSSVVFLFKKPLFLMFFQEIIDHLPVVPGPAVGVIREHHVSAYPRFADVIASGSPIHCHANCRGLIEKVIS
jgi:hypothetical protein